MKKRLLTLFFALTAGLLSAQENYWQQQVNFVINVSLNDKEKTLDAFESIEYINHSPDTLAFIWFHLWPNAFKNDRTAFSERELQLQKTGFYFSGQAQKGYINQLNFQVNGHNVSVETDSNNIDVVKIWLPEPLSPGKKIVMTTPFRVKLPYNFSGMGYTGKDFYITNWFPKPAVYDKNGWHPMPYLRRGGAYNEFGNYDVEITAPSAYVIASTGVLQDTSTLRELKEKGRHLATGDIKTWRYKQDNITDFAWFASPDFFVQYDTAVLAADKKIQLFSYYKPNSVGWNESVANAKEGIRKFSTIIGEYPYEVATIVQNAGLAGDPGNYATLALLPAKATGRDLDVAMKSSIANTWFNSALEIDSRMNPWMEEGIIRYYTNRISEEAYQTSTYTDTVPFYKKFKITSEAVLLATIENLEKDQPIETAASAFSSYNYPLIAGYKAAAWFQKLELELGKDEFDRCMQAYFSNWKFKHAEPGDLKNSIISTSEKNVDYLFKQLDHYGPLAKNKKITKPAFIFKSDTTNRYINISPVIGYNHYDKPMIGLVVNNFGLPLPQTQFLAGAMYATGSNKINGFGRLSYNHFKRNYHLTGAVSFINFSQNDFLTSDDTKLILRVRRLVPSLKLTLFAKDPLLTRRFTSEIKTFFLNEGALNFKTVFTPTDTLSLASVNKVNSYINRFSVALADNRILFPYNLSLVIDQGKDFVKAGFTAKYFFNYSTEKTGMTVRLFAGKFFYLRAPTNLTRILNERYFLNLSGPSGQEDYTYSDYFIGRNEFQGWKSQQLMERDGFFKVNTDLLGDKIGKTDNWLVSCNLSSDLPVSLNPLSILPFKVPLKIFADVGTYAEAWQANAASGRFIYDAGIQVPLFHSLIDVYIPIIYSKVYSNYYKSIITEKRFLKTIAFTININKLKLSQLVKDVPL